MVCAVRETQSDDDDDDDDGTSPPKEYTICQGGRYLWHISPFGEIEAFIGFIWGSVHDLLLAYTVCKWLPEACIRRTRKVGTIAFSPGAIIPVATFAHRR